MMNIYVLINIFLSQNISYDIETYCGNRISLLLLVEIGDPASSPIYWVEIIIVLFDLFVQFFRSLVGWTIPINTVLTTSFATTVWAWCLTTIHRPFWIQMEGLFRFYSSDYHYAHNGVAKILRFCIFLIPISCCSRWLQSAANTI